MTDMDEDVSWEIPYVLEEKVPLEDYSPWRESFEDEGVFCIIRAIKGGCDLERAKEVKQVFPDASLSDICEAIRQNIEVYELEKWGAFLPHARFDGLLDAAINEYDIYLMLKRKLGD